MKNIILLSAVVLTLTLVAFDAPKDDINIRGNGNVLTTSRAVSPFSELEIDGVFNIYLLQGDQEMVKVETDENLQDVVIVKNKDNTLKIKTKDDFNIKHSTKSNIYITLKSITRLEVNSVGKTECRDELKLDRLSLEINSVGKTYLKLDCNQLNAEVNAVGSLVMEGRAKSANIEHTGVGSMNAYDFNVAYLSLEHSGIGSVEAYASKELSISSDGIGSVKYKGPAEVTKLETSGIGSVKKVD
ncbi:head GIN domain-containing protein [Saccharicrinis sp. FJH54]|uniref:head GIN domain-containing protein n=1 Tax=Saccharicrinis sp. FJH54 TaxID=3344665 RepID=UPI0035D3E08B